MRRFVEKKKSVCDSFQKKTCKVIFENLRFYIQIRFEKRKRLACLITFITTTFEIFFGSINIITIITLKYLHFISPLSKEFLNSHLHVQKYKVTRLREQNITTNFVIFPRYSLNIFSTFQPLKRYRRWTEINFRFNRLGMLVSERWRFKLEISLYGSLLWIRGFYWYRHPLQRNAVFNHIESTKRKKYRSVPRYFE